MEKYIQMFKENKSGSLSKEVNLSKVQPELYKNIIDWAMQHEFNVSFKEKVYLYLFQHISIPKCKTCGINTPTFFTTTQGYKTFCSNKCTRNHDDTINKCKETLLKFRKEKASYVRKIWSRQLF